MGNAADTLHRRAGSATGGVALAANGPRRSRSRGNSHRDSDRPAFSRRTPAGDRRRCAAHADSGRRRALRSVVAEAAGRIGERRMKFLLFVFLLVPAFAQRPDPPPPRDGHGRGMPPGKWWNKPDLVSKLKITPDQQRKM